MKIELAANDLAAALTKIKGAVPNRTTLPILETVLFEASAGELRVTASQANMEAGAAIPCDVREHGRAAISSHIIPIVKALGKSPITLSVAEVLDARAFVEGARQSYEFGTLPAEDFPLMQTEEAISFEIDPATLREAFAATAASVSIEREHLAGVCMMRDGAELVFISTDYNRLTRFGCPLPDGAEPMTGSQFTVPQKAVAASQSLIAGASEPVRIGLEKHSISVSTGGSRLVSRLLSGDFGVYDEFIAETLRYARGFTVARSELSEAIARIVALRAETKVPGIKFSADGETVRLVSDRRGLNSGIEQVDAEVGEATNFAVSASFISTLVSVWPESAKVEFSAPHAGKAIRIRSASVPHLLQLLAPMRL